ERGLVFVPALAGLACPYWDHSAAGLWLGMGLNTDKRLLCQAVLEGIALRSAQAVKAIGRVLPLTAKLSIDGGLSRNRYFARFLARALDMTVEIPGAEELTGIGTAHLALLGAGLAADIASLPPLPPSRASFAPDSPLEDKLTKRFADAVERSRAWR